MTNYILAHSCAKTLAQKFNMKSRAQVFQKFGPLLAPNDEVQNVMESGKKKKRVIALALPSSYKMKIRDFKISKQIKDPMMVMN